MTKIEKKLDSVSDSQFPHCGSGLKCFVFCFCSIEIILKIGHAQALETEHLCYVALQGLQDLLQRFYSNVKSLLPLFIYLGCSNFSVF